MTAILPVLLLVACSGGGEESTTEHDSASTPSTTVPVPSGDTAVPATDACTQPATAEIGTGQNAYEPLLDGQELPFYLGPQGGHHVFVSVRATGLYGGKDVLDVESPWLTLDLVSGGTTVASLPAQPRQLQDEGDHLELVGQALVFDVPDAPAYDGAAADLSWSLEDRCGRRFEGTVGVQLVYATEG